MNDTLWQETVNGELSNVYNASDAMHQPALVIAKTPDWVRYPENFGKEELAGTKTRITMTEELDVICPMCSVREQRTVLTTEHGVCVIACKRCGQYSWFMKYELEKLL